MLTAGDIAAARALCDAATPGPWDAEQDGNHHFGIRDVLNGYIEPPDAAFIAAARQGWPAALDAVEQLQVDLEAADMRMAAVLDGTFAVGDGSTQREIERLTAALAAMTAARDDEASQILGHCLGWMKLASHDIEALRSELAHATAVVEAAKAWRVAHAAPSRWLRNEHEHNLAKIDLTLRRAIEELVAAETARG